MAESRVLPLFLHMSRPGSLFKIFLVVLAFPLCTCAAPSELPGPVVVPDGTSVTASQPATESDIKSWGQSPGSSVAASWADLAILAGAEPGPVLMVVAGVHGDEISGLLAARQLASGPPPASGTLVILPGVFPEAMAAGQRWLPGWSDLNRAFPQNGEWGASGTSGEAGTAGTGGVARSARSAYAVSDPTYLRADEILALIVSVLPDLLLDLHESDQYWTEGDGPALVVPASVGFAESGCSAELALALLESPGMEGFAFTGPPPAGSLVAAVDGLLGIPALLVETPDSMAVEDRIAVQLAVVHAALRILGMAEPETGAEPAIPLSGKAP